jgi:hypothetical protein
MFEQVIQNNPESLLFVVVLIFYYGSFLDDHI